MGRRPIPHFYFNIYVKPCTGGKLMNELFRLFAKVLLAPRPSAMCLKMLKFCSSADEYFLLDFCVVCLSGGCTLTVWCQPSVAAFKDMKSTLRTKRSIKKNRLKSYTPAMSVWHVLATRPPPDIAVSYRVYGVMIKRFC